MRLHLFVLGGALAVLLPRAAFAEDTVDRGTEGTVVAIDSGDLIVDIGAARGAHDGELVELWRPVRVKHPVTGKILADRFRIGTVRLSQVQNTLSLAKVDGTFLRPPAAGDQVLLVRALAPAIVHERTTAAESSADGKKDETPAKPAYSPLGRALDADAQAVANLFEHLRGAVPEARVAAYESFAAAHPRSRFAAVLHEEATAIRSASAVGEALETPPMAPLPRVRPGAPQAITVELDPRFVGAVAHVRAKGSAGYRSQPMASVGARYWSVTLPGDTVAPPGVQYFIEGVPKAGAPVAVVGTASSPKDATVDPSPFTGKAAGTLGQVAITSELATFNTKKNNDYVFQTEGTFGWRLGDLGIRAVRSGFGVLRGKGGNLVDLDTLGKAPTSVGLTYGYVETEIGMTSELSLIGRPIIGLRDGGVAGGAQAFFRVGNDLKTNLSVGGEVLGKVGLRGIVQLDWRTIPRVPIVLRSEVTNQPAGFGSDVGARAIGQVGYELSRELTVSVRGSYQGRTINHAGPGAGLGVSYQW